MTFAVNLSNEIRKIQEEDVMFSRLEDGKNKVIKRKFEILKGVIYRKPTERVPTSRIVIPISKFPDIFKQYHIDINDVHFGIDKKSQESTNIIGIHY